MYFFPVVNWLCLDVSTKGREKCHPILSDIEENLPTMDPKELTRVLCTLLEGISIKRDRETMMKNISSIIEVFKKEQV